MIPTRLRSLTEDPETNEASFVLTSFCGRGRDKMKSDRRFTVTVSPVEL